MATTYKVLGQVAPSATTDTNLYTVPSATETVASTLVICNRSTTAATYRVAIRVAGATISNKDYIAFDAAIPGSDTIALTLGLSLAATDVVTVHASTANLSFSVFGSEMA
jgi:hypothetical protein